MIGSFSSDVKKNSRMLKKASLSEEHRGVPRGTLRMLSRRERCWRTFSASCYTFLYR